MGYEYDEQKVLLFSDEGSALFIKVRDIALSLIKKSGAFQMHKIFGGGDVWFYMACIDRMIELGDIVEISQNNVAGQHRIFVGRQW